MFSNKIAGVMFILAASAFVAAGILAEQAAFFAVTIVFVIVGGLLFRKAEPPSQSNER